MLIEIELPWPPPILSPNQKPAHWGQMQKAKKKFKEDCAWLTKLGAQYTLDPKQDVAILLFFHPPAGKANNRDLDNMRASMKYGLDSVAEMWGVNDRRFRPNFDDWDEPVPHGKVRLIACSHHMLIPLLTKYY